LLLGAGLVSALLPEPSEPPGYYDGDDDDAVVASQRLETLADLALAAAPATQSVRTADAYRVPAERVSPAAPGRNASPALRSPPSA
jgi:hypothetical protein